MALVTTQTNKLPSACFPIYEVQFGTFPWNAVRHANYIDENQLNLECFVLVNASASCGAINLDYLYILINKTHEIRKQHPDTYPMYLRVISFKTHECKFCNVAKVKTIFTTLAKSWLGIAAGNPLTTNINMDWIYF